MKKGFSKQHCPKCNGNIYLEPDYSFGINEREYGWQGWCLQCGYTLYLRTKTKSSEKMKV
ncbi:hypothetical protein ACFLYQ_00160 [Chloroflexota bacterium]